MENNISFKEWYRQAVDAVEHLDAYPAYHLLRAFDKNVTQFENEYGGSEQRRNG